MIKRIADTRRLIALSLFALALGSSSASADYCWDSEEDFSGVQGQQGWEYLYRQPNQPLQFLPLFDPVNMNWSIDLDCGSGECFWTLINPQSMHPNGTITSDGRTRADHEVVLGWRAPAGGWYRIEGEVEKDLQNPSTDGTAWRVRAGGFLVDTADLTPGDPTHSFSSSCELELNSLIEFSIGTLTGTDWGDTTLHSIRVYLAADLDRSCDVSAADLGILLGAWGRPEGDVNGDGDTSAIDLAILLASWTGS